MSGDRRSITLHILTDETVQGRHAHADLARMAAAGGADFVQLREKRPLSTRALIDIANRMNNALMGTATRLIINDRVDVALAAGVAGVHLGRDDLDVSVARRLLERGAIIGASASSLEEAGVVAAQPVDYLGVGPVFATGSKADAGPPLGLEGLRAIVRAVELPVVAIGGITLDAVEAVLDTGVAGIAVLSAVVCASAPEIATQQFRRRIDAWRAPPTA